MNIVGNEADNFLSLVYFNKDRCSVNFLNPDRGQVIRVLKNVSLPRGIRNQTASEA